MGNILVKDKDIVVPGEVIAEGMDNLPGAGTYRQGENIHAGKLGLVNIDGRTIKLISLGGSYMPKANDVIIGKVVDVSLHGWRLEINSPYTAMLSMKDATSEYIAKGADLTKYFALGDYMITKIANVTTQKLVDLTMKGPGLRGLRGGRIIEVNTHKVPRIIGKQGSMVSMIKDATGCKISVGQNGWIWIDGEPKMELVAVKAINKIVEESHLSGLTDRVKGFLDNEIKR